MIRTEAEMLAYLAEQGIPYRYIAHAAVMTCAEARQMDLQMPGLSIKNLFVQAGERQWLVVTACEKRLNLRALGRELGVNGARPNFTSPEALEAALGVTPGAVTLLALVNDGAQRVEVVVDRAVWDAPAFLCHPLVNTATLVIAREDVRRFLALTGHTALVVAME